jgi:hypothetical protein
LLPVMNAQLQMLFLMIAGWVNRHQQAIIEHLQEKNRTLLEQLGGRPRRFTDAQRTCLARKARPIGRRKLLTSYEIHYNRHRNHQGMKNQLLVPRLLPLEGRILRQKQLGGLLNYYHREAA